MLLKCLVHLGRVHTTLVRAGMSHACRRSTIRYWFSSTVVSRRLIRLGHFTCLNGRVTGIHWSYWRLHGRAGGHTSVLRRVGRYSLLEHGVTHVLRHRLRHSRVRCHVWPRGTITHHCRLGRHHPRGWRTHHVRMHTRCTHWYRAAAMRRTTRVISGWIGVHSNARIIKQSIHDCYGTLRNRPKE